MIQIVFRFLEEMMGSADALIEVRKDRIRLSVRRRIIQAAIGMSVLVCAAVWLGAGALAIVRGLCGGFSALWGGPEWRGDLTGGLLALLLAAGAIALHLRLSARRELRGLRSKYERIRSSHDTANGTPAGDGEGAARARRSAGDASAHDLGASPR